MHAGRFDFDYEGVFGVDPDVGSFVLVFFTASYGDEIGGWVILVPVSPLAVCTVADFCVVSSSEAAADFEEREASLRVLTLVDLGLVDSQAAEERAEVAATAFAGSVVTADDDAVKCFSKLGHVFRFDLDPIIVAVVQPVSRAWILQDKAFALLSNNFAKFWLDLGRISGFGVGVNFETPMH